jgi:tryptophan-rich sensory protein
MRRLGSLSAFVLTSLLIGWMGGHVTQSSIGTWYAHLQKPALTPPNSVFGPVWTVLYILMAISGWRIWGGNNSSTGAQKILFVTQFFSNAIWSYLFFGLCKPWFAFADIIFLWLCLLILIQSLLRTDRAAGYLLIPYLSWVSYAAYLNGAIAWLNR